MAYDRFRHHRRSIRLPGYDYTRAGAYFVTLVTQNRECLFGDVINGDVRLNAAGEAVTEVWGEIPRHFANVELDEFVVMPNHFHAIVIITDECAVGATQWGVGATGRSPLRDTNARSPLRDANDPTPARDSNDGDRVGRSSLRDADDGSPVSDANDRDGATPVGATGRSPLESSARRNDGSGHIESGPRGPVPRSLGSLIAGFKAASARRVNALRDTTGASLWQRNYYDRIIRDEAELRRIRQYIAENPTRWTEDQENPAIVPTGAKQWRRMN